MIKLWPAGVGPLQLRKVRYNNYISLSKERGKYIYKFALPPPPPQKKKKKKIKHQPKKKKKKKKVRYIYYICNIWIL